jgi:hypothetical protein
MDVSGFQVFQVRTVTFRTRPARLLLQNLVGMR